MKTLTLILLAAIVLGCAAPVKPSGPLGTWFDWRSGKELLSLEADGTGAWKGSDYRKFTWTYDATRRVLTITGLDRTSPELRLSYSAFDGLLLTEGIKLPAKGTLPTEFPSASLVAVNDISKSRKSSEVK